MYKNIFCPTLSNWCVAWGELFFVFDNIDQGTPYILVFLALTSNRRRIAKEWITNDVSALGTYLRLPPGELFPHNVHLTCLFDFYCSSLDNYHGRLVKTIIIPFIFTMMENFQSPSFSIPLPAGAAWPSLDFWNLKACDRFLEDMQF